MIAAWMGYCLAATSLLALAALALENGFRLRRLPLRWVWVCALLGSLSLSAFPWARPALPPTTETRTSDDGATGRSQPPAQRSGESVPHASTVASPRPTDPVRIAAPRWDTMDRPLVLLWVLLSAACTLLLAGNHWVLRRRRRTWRRTRVDGVPALLSRDTGPAVVGFLEGEIVVPGWVLTLDEAKRRLVLAHEEEHLRAGDSRLLALALGALALMPWNAPLWWQVRRLRNAVELDCDGRVLARGSDARTYSTLLVEIGQRASDGGYAFAAFAESSSFLEKRIRAMFHRKPRGWRLVAGVSAMAGVLLTMFACEVPRPTMAERGPTLSRSAERRADARVAEIMIPPELVDRTYPRAHEVAAALVRERHPEAFTGGLPDSLAVWFAFDRDGDIRKSWIGPSRAREHARSSLGCGSPAAPCREAPRGSPERLAAEADAKRFEEEQVRTRVPGMDIVRVLASGARLAGGSRFAVRFASERPLPHVPYSQHVGEWARTALRRDPIAFQPSSHDPPAGLSPQERLVRERYPEIYANGLPEEKAVWVAVDAAGGIRKSWIGPAGFLPAELATRPWPGDDELRRLGAEHQRLEREYLRAQVPDLENLEVDHDGSIIRSWRYHVRVNWAVERRSGPRARPAAQGETAAPAPSTSDTLVLHLSRGKTAKLRVRPPDPSDTPQTCGFPHGDMGWLWWPDCGGYILHGDGSVTLARVHPVVGEMVAGGPAWKAGLRQGDVILSVNGSDARLLVGPFRNLRNAPPDEPHTVRIRRGAEERELTFPVHLPWESPRRSSAGRAVPRLSGSGSRG